MSKKIALFFLGDFRFDARCCNMIDTLIKNNYVDVYHQHDARYPIVSNNKNLKVKNIPVVQIRWIKYLSWFWAVSRVSLCKYDKIVASDLYSLYPLSFKKNSPKIIYDSREIYTELAVHTKNNIKNYILSFMESAGLAKTSSIITTASSDQKFLKSKYAHYNHIKYYTIYNYPYDYRWNKNDFLRKKFNISNDCKILLYQGVIQKNRGLTQFINIIQKSNKINGVIIGYGEHKNYFLNIINKLSLKKKIFILNKIPYNSLLEITASADVGYALIPSVGISNRFALPNKLFEYAAAQLPTLASKLPNLEKAIKSYNLGKCYRYNDLNGHIKFILSADKKKFFTKESSSLKWTSQEEEFKAIVLDE